MLTGTEIALILAASGTFVTSLATLVTSLRNSGKLDKVHESTNGKMDQMLELTARSAKAEGVAQEKANQGGK